MSAKFHPVTDQIDGVTDTFTLPEAFLDGSVLLAYNGQMFDTGENILEQNGAGVPPTVRLNFVPTSDTHNLMLVYIPKYGSGKGIRGYTHPPGGILNEH